MRTLILTSALFAATAAWAQLNLRLVANAGVPFSFDVTGVTATSGKCSMTIGDTGLVRFSTTSGDFIRIGHREARPTDSGPRLVFRRYGDHAVLQAIELGSAGVVRFDAPKKEKEWINLGLTARVEVVALTKAD